MTSLSIRLDSAATTLLLDPAAALVLYWGPRLPDVTALGGVGELTLPAGAHATLDSVPRHGSLLPTIGGSRLGAPALSGSRGGRDWTADFGTFAATPRPGGVTLRAEDPVARLAVALDLDLVDDVLAISTSVINTGELAYRLDWLAAATLTVPEICPELLFYGGAWGAEWRELRQTLGLGTWLRECRRGRTSHDAFPAIVLGEPAFAEDRGLVYGLHLAWSGSHRIAIETQDDGRRAVQLGELLMPGELELAPGAACRTPRVFAACSGQGLNGLMQILQPFVRSQVLRWPGGRMRPRPITLCTWEANYFEHDLGRLRRQAEAAAALGAERFLLDDGWFGRRDDESSGLGDWFPDPRKYPDGLGPLVEHVRGLGMEMALWVEPEMVNEDSELYRAHPDWVLRIDGRPLLTARNQLVLDLGRAEVTDHLFAALDRLLREQPIAALKWDMNRDLVAAGDAQGHPAYRRHVEGLYALLDRLRAAHPELEIESCASGGGRADWGMLGRTQRVWTSDMTDALERQRIQRGCALWLPPEAMGAHVSTSPNHQTGRRHTIAFRSVTAFFGHFGVELDPLLLGEEDRADLAAWIAEHKRLRPLLHGGTPWHLPLVDGRSGHGVVAADRRRALFAVVQEGRQPTRQSPALRLRGLDPTTDYRVRAPGSQRPVLLKPTAAHRALLGDGLVAGGAALMHVGMTLPELQPETALLLELQSVSGG